MYTRETTTYTSGHDSLRTSIVKVWEHKNLIWVFARRDLQVKYAQTHLGFAWSIFKPLLGLSIYVFFGYMLNWTSGQIPYAVYVLTGLVGWNLFTYIISNGVSAVQESTDVIKKIYFPKSILLFSKTVVGLFEATISLALLIPLLIYFEIVISWKIIFVPLVLIFNITCGLATTFIISSISIAKRDFLQVLPYLISVAIWLTPVFLSASIFPERFQFIFDYNPIANVIDLWRWVIFDEIEFKFIWGINFLLSTVVLFFGFYLYSFRENKFADSV
ncbi:ABC transporter permease [Vicingaceae bacterium]|nr:ABC transporter permease [Vicingaceae bacterium]MDC1452428.1 ABC transporter permease [Vicingaceae bacterium]|tara:strand:+ start:3653 stop:4474 length:822 start_codon:yes stop_codon:yes gene_type:complete